MQTIVIKPISVNACWQGRRFKTEAYRSWRDEACLCLKRHDCAQKGNIQLHIRFYLKRSNSDIDNCVKPFLDALTEAGIIEDDRYITKLIVEKIKSDEEKIEYEIKKI